MSITEKLKDGRKFSSELNWLVKGIVLLYGGKINEMSVTILT